MGRGIRVSNACGAALLHQVIGLVRLSCNTLVIVCLYILFQVIGNNELEEKANKGAEALQRGIVFAASLYL